MTRNYRVIDGLRYHRKMLETVEAAVAGRENSQITIETAKKLYEAIVEEETYTQVENDTLETIQKKYKFTPEAEEWLTRELEAWIASKKLTIRLFRLSKSKPEKVGPTIPSAPIQPPKPRPLPERSYQGAISHKSSADAKAPKDETSAATASVAPGKAKSQSQPQSKDRPAFNRLLVVIVLAVLIPVAFLVGRFTADRTDPATLSKLSELEAATQALNQQLIQVTSENQTLKNNLAEATAENEASSIRKQIAGVITEKLGAELANNQIQFDQDQLWLTFVSSNSFLHGGSATLNAALQTRLQRVFPGLIQALKPFEQQISEIRFQGHSSSEWKAARDKSDAYLKNMSLSADRAEAALRYCLTLKEVQTERSWLIDKLVSSGFSDRRPILTPANAEDPAKSRRITISVGVVP